MRGFNAVLMCRAAVRGKPVEEPGFGLHNKPWDCWAGTDRQATRCCCKASKGPDGQVRDMCREVRGQARSAPHPASGLLLINPLGERERTRPSATTVAGADPSGVSARVSNKIGSYTHHSLASLMKGPKSQVETQVLCFLLARSVTSPACLLTNSSRCLEINHVPTMKSVIRRKVSSLWKKNYQNSNITSDIQRW